MTFLHPSLLYLLLLLPIVGLWYWYRRSSGHATLRLTSIDLVGRSGGWRVWCRHSMIVLRLGAIALLILALARPQAVGGWSEQDAEGIDIVLTIDVSSSMEAMDFAPNRLEAAKRVAASFVASREYDNIGLVAFAGESFSASPLTTDHAALITRIRQMRTGIIEDRTAIGLGLATAINRLRDSHTPSKVIILLTDGSNNAGDITPTMAAELARSYGITIHTIGMGSLDGYALTPIVSGGFSRPVMMPVDIDEDTMREVATITGGQYYRASDDSSLEAIYTEIDKLEKVKLKARHYQTIHEEFPLLVLWAAILLLIEFVLRHTLLRTNP